MNEFSENEIRLPSGIVDRNKVPIEIGDVVLAQTVRLNDPTFVGEVTSRAAFRKLEVYFEGRVPPKEIIQASKLEVLENVVLLYHYRK